MYEFDDEPTKGEDAGKLWLQRIHTSLEWRRRIWNGERMWIRSLKLFLGDHWEQSTRFDFVDADSNNVRDEITVNIIGSTVRDFMAFLFKYAPKFLLRARREDALLAAPLKQSLINYWWAEKGWIASVKEAVWDYLIVGHGVVKTGWVLELDEAKKPDKDGLIEWNDAVRKDEPTVRRVDPFKFIVDPEAPERNLGSARWCAESIHKPLRDVLVNERYNKQVRAGVKTGKYKPNVVKSQTRVTRSAERVVTGEDGAGDESLVRLFEVWDKKFKRYYVLLDGVDKPLIEANWPYPYLDGLPYVMAVYDELPNDWYGQSLPWTLEDQQLELNRVRTSEFIHRRRHALTVYGATNAVDPKTLAKFKMAEDGDIIPDLPSRDAVFPMNAAPLPDDNYRVEDIIQNDLRRLSGADQLSSGGSLPSRTSATEISARQDYTGRKIDMRVAAVDCFVTDITRQVLQHMAVNMDRATAVRIDGPNGESWDTLTPDAAKAEVDLEITTVSAQREDETTERQQAIQVFQTIGQMAQGLMAAGYQINYPKVFQWLIGEKFGVKEASEFLVAPPPQVPVDPNAVPGAGGGVSAEGPPGIPPSQVAVQQAAVQPQSGIMGAAMGALGG